MNGPGRSRVKVLLGGLPFVSVAVFANYLFERRSFGPVFLGLSLGNALFVLGLVSRKALLDGLLFSNRKGVSFWGSRSGWR